ncbi:sigma-70 family RNA polymerase sigma factor [Tunicatimonas pelagia]|uniref:sigma-70 family RNA polymerase sigma factor n=1 Tax=Tunicatimonas pelagia TaxID=931531 RepID=UPI0026657188|nr:sigma-70 family RNA polymerase sigma factor [Tunicatimonas pelagia]WKN40931.1 sigma-70 family RNA polymerase sigma factor [Tunicatimonas pelagia]
METQDVWNSFNDELYFFLLKKVKDTDVANDIFQSTFLKIHKNLPKLKEEEKVKAWIFQIARNEIANYFNAEAIYVDNSATNEETPLQEYQFVCCFDKLINDLPEIYQEVINMVYIKGHKQKDVANELGISLENTKARIRRAKDILKEKFQECCKYELDKKGKLTGESNCSIC